MGKGRDTKPHIGIFGRRNNGKSSLINALTGQDIAIVSEIAGTTTDPVKKSMEIEGIGPTILVDTAGIDDDGALGTKRIEKTLQTLKIIDAAILVIVQNTFGEPEERIIAEFNEYDIPFLIIHNKSDIRELAPSLKQRLEGKYNCPVLEFSAMDPDIKKVSAQLKSIIPETIYHNRSLIGALVKTGDIVLLITPVDTEAPEGRMILPQVQVIRDTLDNNCICLIAKETEVPDLIKTIHPLPALAITDSQVFSKADTMIPQEIPLTSFSIVLAHSKGDFDNYLKGTPKLSELKDGDRILIMESCTHHVTCDDIGRSKIPRWLSGYSGKKLDFDIISGLDSPPLPVDSYQLAIQCGGCMFTRKQLLNRLKPFIEANIPVTNYGMAIAWVNGVYKRAVAPFLKPSL
ncbi:MAG TPA: [FeFe] hydrogenase H-cluster maturation GTPase HydF [Bacteroidales bacterium]|nr:[FeFe] hydrogenase H-cluster maturation GTPase HydF [Bacteroidales bacterium]